MRADFHAQRRLQMRERAGGGRGIGAAGRKAGAILRGSGHRQLGAIDAHQPQAKGKTAGGLFGRKGATETLEEVPEHAHPQLPSTIAQGRRGGRGGQGLLRAEAQRPPKAITHPAQRTASHQAPGNEQVDHHQVIELAVAVLLCLILAEQEASDFARIELFKD